MKLLPHIKSKINSNKTYEFLNRLNDKKYKHNYVYLLVEKITREMYCGCRSSNKFPMEDLGVDYFTSSQYVDYKEHPEKWEIIIVNNFSRRSDAICLEAALHKQHHVASNEMFFNRSNQTITGFDISGLTFIRNAFKISRPKKWRGENYLIVVDPNPIIKNVKWITYNRFVGKNERHKRSIKLREKNNPMYEKHHSKASNLSRSKTLTGQKRTPKQNRAQSVRMMGHSVSSKTAKKISNSRKKLNLKQTWVNNNILEKLISISNFSEFINNHPGWVSGRLLYSCEYCNVKSTKGNITRWHNNNCKQNLLE